MAAVPLKILHSSISNYCVGKTCSPIWNFVLALGLSGPLVPPFWPRGIKNTKLLHHPFLPFGCLKAPHTL